MRSLLLISLLLASLLACSESADSTTENEDETWNLEENTANQAANQSENQAANTANNQDGNQTDNQTDNQTNNQGGANDDEGCQIGDCPDGQYCRFSDGQCGQATDPGAGTCLDLPTECTDDIARNCGCDGNFYRGSSSCAAQNEGGVDTHSDHSFCGECYDLDDPDVTYVAHDLDECAAMFYTCDDGEELFQDDCGCGCIVVDDETNQDDGGGRGCHIDDCPFGQYCYYDDDVCGANGAEGRCIEMPPADQACTDDLVPHCGCDGQTYTGSSTCPPSLSVGVDVDDSGQACDGSF